MVDFLLEINDSGDTLEINDSNDQLLILDDTIPVPAQGSGSGGSSKQVGVSVHEHDQTRKKKKTPKDDVGERLRVKSIAESISKLQTKSMVSAFGSLVIPTRFRAEAIIKPIMALAISLGGIVITEKIPATAKMYHQVTNEAVCSMNPLYSLLSKNGFFMLPPNHNLMGEMTDLKDSIKKLEKIRLLHDMFKLMDEK